MTFSAKHFLRPAVVLVCVLVPPMVTNRGWWMVGRTEDGFGEPLEVLGTLVSIAILLYWYAAYRYRGTDRVERIVTRLVTGAIVLQFLLVMVGYWGTSWDYRCYDAAAHQVSRGLNPYRDTHYLYPPLLAQVMAQTNAVVTSTRMFAHDKVTSWWIVFYFYQCVQLFLVFIVVEGLFAYARRLRMPIEWAAVTVATAILVNSPFFNTIRFQQTNLIVLAAIVYSLTRLRRRPLVCGVLMAIAVTVKPLGILFPLLWLLIGARAAALSFVVAGSVLVVAQAGFGLDWTPWRQFIESLADVPKYNDYFRNQSLFSLFRTLTRTLRFDIDNAIVLNIVRVCQLVIAGWFTIRFMDREKRFRAGVARVAAGERDTFDLAMRIGGHSIDLALLALLIAPIVWDHHYVVALPVVLWVVAISAGRIPRLAVIGMVLMFVPSTFDLWLFSYHRLAGVFILMTALSPERAFDIYAHAKKATYWSPAGAVQRRGAEAPAPVE